MVVTDSSIPKFQIYGNIPLLSLRIIDKKIQGILKLIESIPLPKSKPASQSTSTQALINTEHTKRNPQKNMTDFLLTFEISEVTLQDKEASPC